MAGPAVLTVADTIARSFLRAAETRGNRPAIREKKFGIWHPTSWRQWLQISREIAFGLHATGFRPGDVASIIANAVPEWVFADMGILCAGGVSSGIYPTDSCVQVEYLINDSATRVISAAAGYRNWEGGLTVRIHAAYRSRNDSIEPIRPMRKFVRSHQ